MVFQTTINLTKYEKDGIKRIQEKRPVGQSELIREGIRLLMKQENVLNERAV